MTLNNDTRISKGFVSALLDPRLPDDAGIVGPMIDYGFRSAMADQKVAAENYTPRPVYRAVAAVEGTALMVSRKCWQSIGGLDLRTFGRFGWGIDLDLALRARKATYGVYVTEMAYINHFGGKTANARFGSSQYLWGGTFARLRGLQKLHGWGATLAMEQVMLKAYGSKWYRQTRRDYTAHQL
jgi:GT2 family glycosyltransferase